MLRHDLQVWSREEEEEETALLFLLAKLRQKEKLKNQKFESEVFLKVFNRQKREKNKMKIARSLYLEALLPICERSHFVHGEEEQLLLLQQLDSGS